MIEQHIDFTFYRWPDCVPEKCTRYLIICSDVVVNNGIVTYTDAYFRMCHYSSGGISPHWCIDGATVILYWAEVPELPEEQR
jgi:hypothetical protein